MSEPRSIEASSDAHSADQGFLGRVTAARRSARGSTATTSASSASCCRWPRRRSTSPPSKEGLLGASSLAGIFFGAPIFGHLTDRFGRRRIFIFDLIAFVVLGLLQAFVGSIAVLLIVRFALGLAIGAEYAIGQTMLAELVPSQGRGRRLSSLQASWYGGFLLAVVVADVLDALGIDWRLILATGAIPGLVTRAYRNRHIG